MRPAIFPLATLLAALTPCLYAWTITATPKGPNQINLTWPAQTAPGYGYIVEIQSAADPRYPVFTVLQSIPTASGYTCDPTLNWHGNGTGCTISDPSGAYVYNPAIKSIPTWVTEPQYVDPQDDTPAQFIAAGLKMNTQYTFRVRTYTGNTNPTYGPYSDTITAVTPTYMVRYVSTTGNDANDGTAIDDAHAWHTIGMSAGVPCGTLVIVKGGDYGWEYFGLGQACSPAAKVVLQANYGEAVRITTNAHPDWGSVLSLYGINLVVDGIGIAENAQPDYVLTISGSRNALFNMNVGPTAIPSGYGGIALHGNSNLLYANSIHDFGSPYWVQNGSGNGGFIVTLDSGASNNTIWSNHLTRGGHDTGLVHNGSSNKFLNNIADGGWGMAFETVYASSQNNLFEGIVSANAGMLEVNIYKPAFELSYKSNTVRRSVFVNAGKAIEISAYDDTTNNLVYNNVFYNVARCYFQSHNYGVTAYDGVRVQNNICQFTNDGTEIYLNNLTPRAISYNSFFKMGGTGGEASYTWNQDAGGSYSYPVTLAYAEANYGTGVWFGNTALSTAPAAFVDPASMDFHLAAGSPLLKAGTQISDTVWGGTWSSAVDLGAFGLNNAVLKAAAVLTLSSSMNPATAAKPVTLTAALSSSAATGTVQFLDGTTLLGTVAASGGAASLTLSNLSVGTHNITAVYSGDLTNDPATSAVLVLAVAKLTTTVSLSSSMNPAPANVKVSLTATVSPATAGGTVQFFDGATLLRTLNISSGSVTLSGLNLALGSHTITAVYGGDASDLASTSAPLTEVINKVH